MTGSNDVGQDADSTAPHAAASVPTTWLAETTDDPDTGTDALMAAATLTPRSLMRTALALLDRDGQGSSTAACLLQSAIDHMELASSTGD